MPESVLAPDQHRLRLNRYELAMGLPPSGADPGTEALPAPPRCTARAALERSILEALARPPCVVSFSGGRDSSAVLAVASRVARRERLPLPVPVSLRFPDVEGTDETKWQELVVRHLGLEDWERVAVPDVDFVGPLATGVLRRHGLLWPPNTHFHVPMLESAAGGSLLTGVDGDGLFGGWRWTPLGPSTPIRQRIAQRWRFAARAGANALPSWLRYAVGRRRMAPSAWIRPDAWPDVARYLTSVWEPEPRRWDERVAWWSRRRHLACIRWSMSLLASDHDVQLAHPLLDRSFLAAIARDGGATGFGDRTAVMHALFGDLLPEAVLDRESKAYFDGATWGTYTRRFVKKWDGQGVDESLVDAEILRSEWEKSMPLFTAAPLLQSAWLATSGTDSPGTCGAIPTD